MGQTDPLGVLLASVLDERLKTLLRGTELTCLSRIPSQRIASTALPHIALIESVSAPTFERHYRELYEFSFHGGERERSDLIVARLGDEFTGLRHGLAPYRIIGLRDADGIALGAAQFSVLLLSHHLGQKRLAVPYLQYIYIRPSHRRQDLSEILHTLVLAVAIADAKSHWDTTIEVEIPYTLCETEPPVHGLDEAHRAKAKERAGVHSKSGGIALMLRDSENNKRVISAHVQPGLETGQPPITLIWILRANPAVGRIVFEDQQVCSSLLKAYYQSLRDEGFLEQNIRLAERLVDARRSRGCRDFCLLDIADVTEEMYVGIDQDDATTSRSEVAYMPNQS